MSCSYILTVGWGQKRGTGKEVPHLIITWEVMRNFYERLPEETGPGGDGLMKLLTLLPPSPVLGRP